MGFRVKVKVRVEAKIEVKVRVDGRRCQLTNAQLDPRLGVQNMDASIGPSGSKL